MSTDSSKDKILETEVIFIPEDEASSKEPPMTEWSSINSEASIQNVKRQLHSKGLYSPGSGEICTKYVTQSDSSVLRHEYYNYPAIHDPGIIKALLQPPEKVIHSNDGQELYLAICKEENICPVRIFHRGLTGSSIDLRYYAVNPMHVHAMASALEYNKTVKTLDLTDNFLNNDACYHLGQMLVGNLGLTELNLSGCRIGPGGLKRVLYGLLLNRSLRSINLSGNQLGDTGIEHLADAILRGIDIERIYLSRNEISSLGLKCLVHAFETHKKLTHVDLSWNNLFSPLGTTHLINALSTSDCLKVLNLSWNSLAGRKIAEAIRNLLKAPKLEQLNLSNNQFYGEAITSIIENLFKAKKLITLNLSSNPLSPEDALQVLNKMRNVNVKVQNVFLDNVYVTKAFEELLSEIKTMKSRKNFVITYGGVYNNSKATGPDPREILLDRADYLAKKPKRAVDIALFMMQLLKDRQNTSSTIPPKELFEALRAAGAPVDEDLVNEIAEVFGIKKQKQKMVDLKILVEYMKRKWPERKLPPTPPETVVPEPEPTGKKATPKVKK